LDRLITEPGPQGNGDAEDDSEQATMANVEEMLEGYEWASDDVIGRKTARGAADLIQARLLDELVALEKVFFLFSFPVIFRSSLSFLFKRPMYIPSSNQMIV
jgi:hypothetical protein